MAPNTRSRKQPPPAASTTTAPQPEQATQGGPPTVTIGRHTATLTRCSDLLAVTVARTTEEIEAMEPGQVLALGAAALAGCWPDGVTWPARLRPRPWDPSKRSDRYGQEVFDGLCSAGHPTVHVIHACQVALRWAWSLMVSEQQVEDAVGNSSARGGAA